MTTIITEEYKYEEYNYNLNDDIELRPYQKATIHKMMERERMYKIETTVQEGRYYNRRNKKTTIGTNIGVLSNKVGSGKTFITIGLIGAKTDMSDSYYNNNYHYDVLFNNSTIPKEICTMLNEYCQEDEQKNKFITYKKEDDVEELNTNLIIVPHNLLNQWKEEIQTKTKLKSKFICKAKDINEIDFKKMDETDIVLCSSTQLKRLVAKLDTEDTTTLWNRIFIDEVDTMNVPNFPNLKSKFLWLISTTYERILKPKNSGFIKGLFNDQHSNYDYDNIILDNREEILSSITLICEQSYIDKYMYLETYEKRYKLIETSNEMKVLYSLGNVIYNRAIGSNDKDTIVKYLSENISINNIYNMSNHDYGLYDMISYGYIKNINSTYNNFIVLELLNKMGNCYNILNGLNNNYNFEKKHLRMYYKNLRIIENIMKYYLDNNKCILCNKKNKNQILKDKIHHSNCSMDQFQNRVIRTFDFNKLIARFRRAFNRVLLLQEMGINPNRRQGNNYYEQIIQHFRGNEVLPQGDDVEQIIAREVIKEKTRTRYNKYMAKMQKEVNKQFPPLNINNDNKLITGKTKCDILMESLAEDITNGEKCLIFSDNMNFFKELSDTLKNNGVLFKVLKGNNYVIRNILKKYKSGELNVLLMNMKYCGSGLNLQMSTKIYIMNYLDISTETQVIGRANRFGRVGDLDVNFIFYDCEQKVYLKNNIKEEDILEL